MQQQYTGKQRESRVDLMQSIMAGATVPTEVERQAAPAQGCGFEIYTGLDYSVCVAVSTNTVSPRNA